MFRCRACRYLRQTSAIKTLCQFPCAKGKLQCKKSKTNSGKMQFCRLCKACKNNFCSSGFCQTDGVKCCLGVVLVLYLGKQFAKKPLPIPVCKRANYSAKSQKQTSGKYFFQCKKRQTAGLFFVVEVLILQKYKSKNNNDFLENAFIMSF